MNNSIITEFGLIKGRDALYLDDLLFSNNEIQISGETNLNLCSKPLNGFDWVKYCFKFKKTSNWSVFNTEDCPKRLFLHSSIEEFNTEKGYKYAIFTYDWIFEIESNHKIEMSFFEPRQHKQPSNDDLFST